MSGIVGCFNRDGGPVDESLIKRMLGQVSHRGPDGAAVWVRGPMALGHAMLQTTPESLRERQPCFDEAAGICIVMDGRVDNRSELLAELGVRAGATDAEIVLAAYGRWATNCPARIIGDFAFALWDERTRTLLCARDPFGRKPLFYASCGDAFLFASEPRALLEDGRVSAQPNEGVVAEYLTVGPRSMEETLLESVRRLPPAHLLKVGTGAIRLERYWDFDASNSMRHRSDAEYAEHFMAIFRQAVGCRMRVPGTVGVVLSGGLDSTSILCVGEMLRREGATSGLESFSMAFPGTLCDETTYIDDVVQATGVASTVIPWTRQHPSHFADRARLSLDFPGYPNGDFLFGPLEALAVEKNIRVLLTGHGGDEGLSGSVYHYADMLKRLQWFELIRQVVADRKLLEGDQRLVPFIYPNLGILRQGVFPLVPARWRWAIKRAMGLRLRTPEWVEKDFCRRARLDERVRPRADSSRYGSFSQRYLAGLLSATWSIQEMEVLERMSAAVGVELRSPFMDRRLLEFALAVPEDQRWRGEETKFVLRQAMRGLLPESVRTRRTKADFSHMVVEALGDLTREGFWDSLEVTRRGWIDNKRLKRAAGDLEAKYRLGGDEYLESFWPLWMAVGIEFWIRGLSAPRS